MINCELTMIAASSSFWIAANFRRVRQSPIRTKSRREMALQSDKMFILFMCFQLTFFYYFFSYYLSSRNASARRNRVMENCKSSPTIKCQFSANQNFPNSLSLCAKIFRLPRRELCWLCVCARTGQKEIVWRKVRRPFHANLFHFNTLSSLTSSMTA